MIQIERRIPTLPQLAFRVTLGCLVLGCMVLNVSPALAQDTLTVSAHSMFSIPYRQRQSNLLEEGEIEGTWVGGFEMEEEWICIVVYFSKEDGDIQGTADIGQEDEWGLTLTQVRFEPPCLHFELPRDIGPLIFDGRLQEGVLSGEVEQADERDTFYLSLVVPIDPALYSECIGNYRLESDGTILFFGRSGMSDYLYYSVERRRVRIYPLSENTFFSVAGETITFVRDEHGDVTGLIWHQEGSPDTPAQRVQLHREEEVRFQNGDVTLSGTLMIPPTDGPHPAVVFVQGSGAETREHRRGLADRFARQGIAALIYDKRGTGDSMGDWYTASFDDLAADSLAAVRFLKGHADIHPEQIGLWGLSQGGWIVPLAASRSEDVAFIIVVSGAGVSPAEQELYRWGNALRDLGYSDRAMDTAMKGLKLQFDLDRLNLPLVDTLFLGLDFYHDPVPVLGEVAQPVLAIWGDADELVPPRTSAAVFDEALQNRGNQGYTIRVFPDAHHGIGLVDTGVAWAEYAPGYLSTMTDWILERTGSDGFLLGGESADVAYTPSESEVVPSVRLPWYGTATFQLSLIGFLLLVFLSACVGWPIGYLARRLRKQSPEVPRDTRLARLLAGMVSFLNLAILISFVVVLILFLMVDEQALKLYLDMPAVWIVSLLTCITTVRLVVCAGQAWRSKYWGVLGRVHYTLVIFAGLVFVPFLLYWNLLGF